MKLSETWKDEAIAFILLVIALIFMTRAWSSFVASQADRTPRLEAYQPRQREVERIIEREDDSMIGVRSIASYGTAMMSPIRFASGVVIHAVMADDDSRVIYYR